MKYILSATPESDEWVDFDTAKDCVAYLVENNIDTAEILLMDDSLIGRTYVWYKKNLYTKLPREPEKHLEGWLNWP
jgi:hypothetical protein